MTIGKWNVTHCMYENLESFVVHLPSGENAMLSPKMFEKFIKNPRIFGIKAT
jgi:hypothetical protein